MTNECNLKQIISLFDPKLALYHYLEWPENLKFISEHAEGLLYAGHSKRIKNKMLRDADFYTVVKDSTKYGRHPN